MSSKSESQDKANYSIEPVENTPFNMVKNENGYFLVIGNKVVTRFFDKKEDLVEYMSQGIYDIIFNMTIGMFSQMHEEFSNKKEVENAS